MADTGKQSPLGVNAIGSLVQNIGFWINPTAASYMGKNKLTDPAVGSAEDYEFGKVCENTCLKWLTWSIHDGFQRGAPRYPKGANHPDKALASQIFAPPGFYTLYTTTYNNLVTIGQSRIPALGNTPPATWETSDPSGVWKNTHPEYYSNNQAGAPATSGYPFWNWENPVAEVGGDVPSPVYRRDRSYVTEGQQASWYPFLCSVDSNTQAVPNRAITMWGWVRCIALQAWQDYNFGNEFRTVDPPEYRFFCDSFNSFYSYSDYINQAIYSIEDSKTFLKGVYSNQDDLISADVSGISLSSRAFGQDLINLGKALDLTLIQTFGLPSTLLQTLQKNNALTQPFVIAMMTAGIAQNDINAIANGVLTATKDQEQKIYSAMLIVRGTDLDQILVILNCSTKNLESLADLVNIKKMFPTSYTTLTVPIYNTTPGPTNSKTYYLLFVAQEMNPQLVSPKIIETVGTILPAVVPPPPPKVEPPPPVIEDPVIVIQPVIQPVVEPIKPPPGIIVIEQPPSIPAPDPVPQVGGGGGCVALESYIPFIESEKKHNGRDVKVAWMLESDMKISLGTDDLQITTGYVHNTLNDYQPCLRITTVDGITLVCSTTARILTKEEGYRPATDIFGKRIAVMRNGRVWYDEVIGLEDVGMRFVRVIDAGGNGFWAGERPDSYILHHNVIVNNDTNEISKN